MASGSADRGSDSERVYHFFRVSCLAHDLEKNMGLLQMDSQTAVPSDGDRSVDRRGSLLQLSCAQRVCLAVLLMGALTFAVVLVLYLAERRIRLNLTAKPNALTPLVGTWHSETGNIINLRSDGTARGRSTKSSTPDINYFEWTVANGQFVVEMAAERREYARRFRQFIFGATTIHYDIIGTSPTEIRLRDTETGKTVVFTLIDDQTLETAP